jgi:dTDP-4-amino-4,6-dideoxygalactose transaminase
LWTSPITFVASANCALYCGATIDFVDIEPDTALMSVERLKEKLECAEKEGKLPKIVIPVHFAGQPCDMKGIYALSQKYNFKIIEDAAHAIGAKYRDKPVGNCRYSDITVFSFHPVKIITTGEGGAAMTNSLLLAEKMELLRGHGITRDPLKMKNKSVGSWYYEQLELGFNYRMTDIQAALGSSQLNRLDKYVASRAKISRWYDEKFKYTPISPLMQKPDIDSAHHIYVVKLDGKQLDRDEIYKNLQDCGIGVNLHYIPINKQPFFQKKINYTFDCKSLSRSYLKYANEYYFQAFTIPLYPGLKLHQLEYIVRKVCRFCEK